MVLDSSSDAAAVVRSTASSTSAENQAPTSCWAGVTGCGGSLDGNVYFYDTANTNHRPNPNFSSITDIFSGITSNYEAMVASFKHQLSHHISASANYTWSHALDYGEKGIRIIRFSDVDILKYPDAVQETIYRELTNLPPP